MPLYYLRIPLQLAAILAALKREKAIIKEGLALSVYLAENVSFPPETKL